MKINHLVFAILLAFVSSCKTRSDVNLSDYPEILTVNELAEYYDLKIDKSGKSDMAKVTEYFDGSSEFEYTYELLETEKFDPLYYSITIEIESSIKDAEDTFDLGKGTLSFIGNRFGQGTVEIDSLKLPGDDSYYAIRTFENNPNGLFYMVRKGTRIFTLIISGIYTGEHSIIQTFVNPKLIDLDQFQIIKDY